MNVRFVTLIFCLLIAPGASGAVEMTFDPGASRWNLRNGWLDARFQLTQSGQFLLESIRNFRTGSTWRPPAGGSASPIRLATESNQFDASTSFILTGQSVIPVPREGQRQIIELDDAQGGGHFTVHLELYEDQPVLRYQVLFRNTREGRVYVRMADMLPWRFQDLGRTWRTFRVNQWVGGGYYGNFEPLEDELVPGGFDVAAYAGAYGQQCGWLAFRDQAGRGLVTGWEFDGRALASVRHNVWAGSVDLTGEILDLHAPVEPGETFEVPAAFLGLFLGNWDDGSSVTHRFVEKVLAPPPPDPDKFPYVSWNSWKYQTNVDELTLRRNAQIAANLGIELFVVDLGWSRQIGDWRYDPRKFPSGLRTLSDYVHSLGMKFGVHFALTEAAPGSPVLTANPDWRSSETYGYFGAESICLAHKPVKDWLIAEAVRMIDDYNLDWIVQDGENMVKKCTKSSHTHDPANSNYDNAVNGINAVVREIRRLRPNTAWENCEDGGNMMTFNMVRNYVTSITCDDSGVLTSRQATWGALYPFPPRYTDRYMPDSDLNSYITGTFLFGGPWIFMNKLPDLSQASLANGRVGISLFKALRGHIRDGKVYHLTGRPDSDRTDALESLDPVSGKAVVVVVRAGDASDTLRIRPRGLRREVAYNVRFENQPARLALTGQQLFEEGLTLQTPGMWTSEIVYIEPQP